MSKLFNLSFVRETYLITFPTKKLIIGILKSN